MAFLCLVASCYESQSSRCAAGHLCPAGRACDDAHGGCVDSAQISACAGKVQGDECTTADLDVGVCLDGVCLRPGCGNRALDQEEVCDDGNNLSGDGCSADCRSDETCGNSVVDVARGETCDDGNTEDGDHCRSNCVLPSCGNGAIDSESSEVCDEGAGNSNQPDATCRINCLPRRCGDGIVDTASGESCDDGNVVSGDGCRPDCVSDETCGNGQVDALTGESCDDGGTLAGDGCTSLCRLETPVWRRDSIIKPPHLADLGSGGPGFVYDVRRNRVVTFGGFSYWFYDTGTSDRTFEYAYGAWRETAVGFKPPRRQWHALAYDSGRGVTVLFGGESEGASNLSDTWEWDGISWKQRYPADAPSPRLGHAMTYDSGRGVTVLFSSFDDDNDTWEWDGNNWVNKNISGPTGWDQVAYDPSRGVTVFFNWSRETWEYNGNAWSLVATGAGPTGTDSISYDPELHGVRVLRGTSSWLWNGSVWSQPAESPALPAGGGLSLLADTGRGRLLALYEEDLGSVWEPGVYVYEAGGWQPEEVSEQPPGPVSGFGLVHDSDRNVLLLAGGIREGAEEPSDVWEWDGKRWAKVAEGTGPDTACAMAYDRARSELVAFCEPAATWTYKQGIWTVETPGTSPPARTESAMAYDLARAEVVLFGGNDGGLVSDTWVWNGNNWQQKAPAQSPPPREQHALAYDPVRERIVLFGGSAQLDADPESELADDTWEWDGQNWQPIATLVAPPPSAGHALTYSPARQSVVLFGGQSLSPQTWEWDGSNWLLVPVSEQPPARLGHEMVFDPIGQEILTLQGRGPGDALRFFAYDASADLYVDLSEEARSLGGADVPLFGDPGDAFFIASPVPFDEISIKLAVAGVGCCSSWRAWNGLDWDYLDINSLQLNGEPVGYTRVFEPHPNWQPKMVAGQGPYYVVRSQMTGSGYSPAPILHSVAVAQQISPWRYRWLGDAREECLGFADSDGDGLQGCNDPDCWGVCRPSCPPGATCDASAPSCGDGSCSGAENCHACPADCGACPVVCGDAICAAAEMGGGCPGDC